MPRPTSSRLRSSATDPNDRRKTRTWPAALADDDDRCKRLCVDTGYYATFNRDNVELVDVAAAPITEITAAALRTTSVRSTSTASFFATGFDAMTGALSRIDIRVVGGMR